jgi:hypothetical protein
MIIFLDSNVLGLIENGSSSPEAIDCTNWFYTLYGRGCLIFTSHFCLYEVRRSLLKEKLKGKPVTGLIGLEKIRNDGFIDFIEDLEGFKIENILEMAGELWARATINNQSTSDKDLDIDLIIAVYCQLLEEQFPNRQVIVATKNLRHLRRFCTADNWQNI